MKSNMHSAQKLEGICLSRCRSLCLNRTGQDPRRSLLQCSYGDYLLTVSPQFGPCGALSNVWADLVNHISCTQLEGST
eukprot:5333003-Amphidinium_carterae.1